MNPVPNVSDPAKHLYQHRPRHERFILRGSYLLDLQMTIPFPRSTVQSGWKKHEETCGQTVSMQACARIDFWLIANVPTHSIASMPTPVESSGQQLALLKAVCTQLGSRLRIVVSKVVLSADCRKSASNAHVMVLWVSFVAIASQ